MSKKKQTGKKGLNSTTNNATGKQQNPLKKYYYLLGLIAFFLFANSIGNEYNLDDNLVTRGNQITAKGLSAIKEIFTSNYYSDEMGYAFGYRPMVHLSFAIEHQFFGEKPGVGHFFNVILFALIVVLFFKLMLKWVGEKSVLFAGIVALLFAVHPIHTEVVDSLKNRDELLAFLFVIWAALSMHKFLESGKWRSLLAVLILFTLAMLSKKSAYPMAIVLPTALIILKEISIKQIVLIGIAFILPAAIFGSELNPTRLVIMLFVPTLMLSTVYFAKHVFLVDNPVDQEKVNFKKMSYPLIACVAVILAAVMFSNPIILFLTLPLFFWMFTIEFNFSLVVLLVAVLSIDMFWLENRELQFIALLLGYGFAFYHFIKHRKLNWLWVSVAAICLAYFFYQTNLFSSVVNVLWISAFVGLIYIRSWLGFVVGIIALMGIYYFKTELHISALSMIVVGGFWFIYKMTTAKLWIHLIAPMTLGIAISFIALEKHTISSASIEKSRTEIAPSKKKFVKNDNILKEGRELVYVENTLTAPHSREERIGTGFATMGEYLRLMAFPYELSFYYGFARTNTVSVKNAWIWLVILIHVAMLILAVFQLRRNPIISIGIMWYLLAILLFSNWVELVAGMVGERLAFTASAGFCIMVTGILFWLKPNINFRKPGFVEIGVICALILFSGRTFVRNMDWKNTLTLMGNDIEHLQNSSQANNMYAMNLMAETNLNKQLSQQEILEMRKLAIQHFEKSVNIYPDYFNVYIDMARVCLMTGDYESGVESINKAIKIDPENQYSYYFSLSLLEKTGDYKTYLQHAKKLFKLNENEETYGGLARGYFLLQDYMKSKEILLDGIKKYPNNEGLKYNLALVEQTIDKQSSTEDD